MEDRFKFRFYCIETDSIEEVDGIRFGHSCKDIANDTIEIETRHNTIWKLKGEERKNRLLLLLSFV